MNGFPYYCPPSNISLPGILRDAVDSGLSRFEFGALSGGL